MNTSHHYARALYGLPKPDAKHIQNLFAVLERRGHQRLAPRILVEYKKLVLQKERAAMHAAVTPRQEQTRALTELYRRLVATK